MITTCLSCQGRGEIPLRQGMMQFIPRVCGPVCLARHIGSLRVAGSEGSIGYMEGVAFFPKELKNPEMRSGYERTFAQWLVQILHLRRGIDWWYEPFSFELPHKTYSMYVPDFLLAGGVFVETKGRWNEGDKTKMRLFVKTYSYPLLLLDAPLVNMLKKAVKQCQPV